MKIKKVKKRDYNIAMNSSTEINLSTRSIQSKKVYNRKKLKKVENIGNYD